MSTESQFAAEMRVVGRKGTIYLHDYIGADLLTGGGMRSKDLIAQLNAHADLAEVELHINSAGGSAWDGIAMHNALKSHKARVTVEVDSLAGSAASVVAMAGDTVRMASGSMLMLHNPRSGAIGQSKDLRKRAEMLDHIRESAIGIYAAKSGKTPEEIGALMDAETWMNADDAKEMGFADEVVERQAIAACLDLSGFQKVPGDALKLIVKETPVMADKTNDIEKKDEPPVEKPDAGEDTTVIEPPAPKAPEPTQTVDVQALLADERRRVQAINHLCRQAGMTPAKEKELIESGATMESVNAAVLAHMLATRKPVDDDTSTVEDDPDAKLKVEYKDHAERIRKMGAEPVSEELYIKSRKRAG